MNHFIYDIMFAISLVVLASLPFMRSLWKMRVESSRFRMFAVRDELVLLVAKGLLKKDSVIFTHYYRMSNDVLRMTDNMHFEGLFQALFTSKQSEAHREKRNQTIKIVHDQLKHEDECVRHAVLEYYEALIEMTLVNSNLFSMIHIISRKMLKKSFQEKAIKWASQHDPKPAMVFRDVEKEMCSVGLA